MINKNNKTVREIRDAGLCTGCGTCAGVCPNSAIALIKNDSKGIYIPELNEEMCNQCGICHEVCPGHEVDFKQLNLEIFGKEPEDVLIGNYLNGYIGYATDYEIRYNSASGGLVTVLLIFALEEGFIDGALVTRMRKDNPLEPEPFIARTKEEIIEASKSKYCPVPANIALKEILESKEEERFAVVGLPCHIHGVRKAEQINKKLKEKIVLRIGIFCGHTPNFLGTEFLLQRFDIKKKDIKKLNYRGEGWPGGLTIELKNGEEIFIPEELYFNSGFWRFFYPKRCTLCCDGICELADISFGDAWLPELADDKTGTTIVISRSKAGDKILQSAVSEKKIKLNRINSDKVIQSQKGMLRIKKNDLKARISLFRLFCKEVPVYIPEPLKSSPGAYLDAILLYFRLAISKKRYLWVLIRVYASLKQYLRILLKRVFKLLKSQI